MNNDTDKADFKKPDLSLTNATRLRPSVPRRLMVPQQTQNFNAPSQAGCSTLASGGYRQKVALKPGHSALDWHELSTTKGQRGQLLTGVSDFVHSARAEQLNHSQTIDRVRNGVPPFIINPPLKIDKIELAKHNTPDDCWCAIKQRVYCLTPYFDFHPGGKDILLKSCAGKDATVFFNKYHRWVNVERLLGTCCIGVLV
ncbi:LAMI_0F10616g1_1 [Lachancea mirantina]|uniref:LAMI_0F10616g1_1 n=1 Tax=Lachancea mirantina TaxID=1230905 RepID=A0A1G4K279_9SACH|nr:LAMI_0F10616g1_1 [Lachancea mirantina]